MNIFRENEAGFTEAVRKMNRRAIPGAEVRETVAEIIATVQSGGDAALCDFAARFDRVQLTPAQLRVTDAELAAAQASVPQDVKDAIAASLENIAYFSRRSMRQDWSGVNAQGCEVGERFVPYERVGIYVPGGKAPLVSTALMTGGFAKAVGGTGFLPGADSGSRYGICTSTAKESGYYHPYAAENESSPAERSQDL